MLDRLKAALALIVRVVVLAVSEEGEVTVEPVEQLRCGFRFGGELRARRLRLQFLRDVLGSDRHGAGIGGSGCHVVEDAAQLVLQPGEVLFGEAIDLETNPRLLLRKVCCGGLVGLRDQGDAGGVGGDGWCLGT